MSTVSGTLSPNLSLRSAFRRTPPVVWALVIMIVFFASREPRFLTLDNLVNLLRQGSILMILSMGVTVATVTGGIDLSVGAVMTLAGMVMAWVLVNSSAPVVVALLAALLVGLLFGAMNGILVSRLQIPSFIATLGTQGIALGLSLGMTNGYVISGLPSSVDHLGNGFVLGLPIPIWLSAVSFCASFVLLRFTKFGIYAYAIGGNEDALVLAGKPAWRYKAMTFAYAGLMAGLAAIVVTSRSMAAQPTVGLGMEFEAFSATVLGGVFAGRGGAGDAVLGVLFILILRNGLNVMGVPAFFQLGIIGSVLITGIILSLVLERRLNR